MARVGVPMPKWWSALVALGGWLCAVGVITRWVPLIITALVCNAVVVVTYARIQWFRRTP